MNILDQLIDELGDETIVYPEFEDCLVGYVEDFGKPRRAVYDKDKVIEKLCLELTHIEAIEHYYHNILGGYIGETTPSFITILKDEK